MWASAVAKGIRIGRTPGGKPGRRGHVDRKPRRPRPIGGPGKGRPPRKPRKLTTSEAAIRRFEQRKRKQAGTGRGTPRPRRPWGPQGGPRRDAKPTGRGPRTSRTTRTAIARSESRRPKRTTSQAAIARFKAMRGRRRR